MNLGDAGADNSDAGYTGDYTPDATISVDYVREKGRQFQSLLNDLDAGYGAAIYALSEVDGIDPDTADGLAALVEEFESKKLTLKLTAEAFNAGASLINAAGGRLPELSIPQTLGFAPIVVSGAMIAAVATAATLITWGVAWLQGLNDRLATAQLLDAQDTPEARAKLAAAQMQARNALAASQESPVVAIAGAFKWVALAALGWFAYKAISASHASE